MSRLAYEPHDGHRHGTQVNCHEFLLTESQIHGTTVLMLEFETALELACCIAGIPNFPPSDSAIVATADDLIRWCRGATINDRVWSAEAQASWLVTEARNTWNEWLGTSWLLRLFRGKFDPVPAELTSEEREHWSPRPNGSALDRLMALSHPETRAKIYAIFDAHWPSGSAFRQQLEIDRASFDAAVEEWYKRHPKPRPQ